MGSSIARHAESCQAPSRALIGGAGSQACDLLGSLRRAVTDAGWTEEALSQHLGTDRSYINRMFNGEKPLSLERVAGFPSEIVARFGVLVAEASGAVVVVPSTGDEAIRDLVSGLLGVLARSLPARASRMAKADLQAWDGEERRRA